MLVQGVKMACDACIRGHRVSTCQHSNRELRIINRKGRPITQCSECKQNRKSRNVHVKCDCGEKALKMKCIHLQPPVEGHSETCCCNHGGECSCCKLKSATIPSNSPTPSMDSVPIVPSRRERSTSCQSTQSQPPPAIAATQRRRRHTDSTQMLDHHQRQKLAHKQKTAQRPMPFPMPLSGAYNEGFPGSLISPIPGSQLNSPALFSPQALGGMPIFASMSAETPTTPAFPNIVQRSLNNFALPAVDTQRAAEFNVFANNNNHLDMLLSASLDNNGLFDASINSPMPFSTGFLNSVPDMESSRASSMDSYATETSGYVSSNSSLDADLAAAVSAQPPTGMMHDGMSAVTPNGANNMDSFFDEYPLQASSSFDYCPEVPDRTIVASEYYGASAEGESYGDATAWPSLSC